LVLASGTFAQLNVRLPATSSGLLHKLQDELARSQSLGLDSLENRIGSIAGGTASVFNALTLVLMVPLFAFYLLEAFDRIVERARDLIPPRHRPLIVQLAVDVDGVLSQFLRGQLTVMVMLAFLYAAGFTVVGVPLAIPIGLCAGLLSFIPYVGGGLGIGLALLMTALHWTGVGQLIAVVSVYFVIQLLESFVITPRVVGNRLGLSPIWVLFALLAGGELFGFVGIMIALPVSAVLKVFVFRGIERYRMSELFAEDVPTSHTARSSHVLATPPHRRGRRRIRKLGNRTFPA
jgi:predicted PurR-regulated permease PerM